MLAAILAGCADAGSGAARDGGVLDDTGIADTDLGDSDSESTTEGDCPGYPAPPLGWDLEHPLPLAVFPAVHGDDGAATELATCQLFIERDATRSVVFAIGAPS